MHQDVAVAVLAFVWDRLYVATLFCALYPLQLSATSFVHWNPLKDSLGRNIIQGTWKRARAKFLHLSLNIKISFKKKSSAHVYMSVWVYASEYVYACVRVSASLCTSIDSISASRRLVSSRCLGSIISSRAISFLWHERESAFQLSSAKPLSS